MRNTELAAARRMGNMPGIDIGDGMPDPGEGPYYPHTMLEGVVAWAVDQLIHRNCIPRFSAYAVTFRVEVVNGLDEVSMEPASASRFFWQVDYAKPTHRNLLHTLVWIRKPMDGKEQLFAPIGFNYYLNPVMNTTEGWRAKGHGPCDLICDVLRLTY